MNSLQIFLLGSGLGTIPIALSYGLVPQTSLPGLHTIPASTTSEFLAFHAVRGLYLGFSRLWTAAPFNKTLVRLATYTLIIFMCGLVCGRMINLLLDGITNRILCGYMFGRGFLALVAIILLKKLLPQRGE